jgi:Leucine-rich repeat (LRR) protein
MKLQADTFSNNTFLEDIDISRNSISELDSMIFQNRRLGKLDISSNVISELHVDTFRSAFQLTFLNLSQNIISYIEPNQFSNNRATESKT